MGDHKMENVNNINPKQTKGGRNQDAACLAASPGQ